MSSKLKQTFAKPIVVGLIAAIGAQALGANFDVKVVGVTVSSTVFYGVVGVGSSLATETVRNFVLPYLPQSAYATQVEAAVLAPAINAALNLGFLQLVYPSIIAAGGYMQPLILGVGSQVAGSYAFDNFVSGMSWMQ